MSVDLPVPSDLQATAPSPAVPSNYIPPDSPAVDAIKEALRIAQQTIEQLRREMAVEKQQTSDLKVRMEGILIDAK